MKTAWCGCVCLLLNAASARAEVKADVCATYKVSLAPEGLTVPSNTPAVGYFTPGGFTVQALSLQDPNGQPIALGADTPALFGWVASALSSPLPEAKGYKISLSALCTASYGSGPNNIVRVFDVGPASPLPTSIGTATILPVKPDEAHPTVFNLSVTFTPEMQAYLPVSAVWIKQGAEFRAEPRYEAPYQLPLTMLLYGSCSAAQVGQQVQVPVEVGADILGAASQPPKLSLTLDYECVAATTPPITDAGAGGADSTAPTDGATDCGCHSAPAAFSGVAVLLLTLTSISAAGRRRRTRCDRGSR
jgi:hypothetical protein